MRKTPLETLIAIYGILFFTSPFPLEIVPSAAISLYRYTVWGLSTLMVLIYHRRALYIARYDLFLWGIIALQLLSFIWSINPDLSLDKGREVIQMGTFSLFMATRFDLKQQLNLVAASFCVGAVLSLLLGLLLPSVGIHAWDHPGAWKGIYDYKNTLGSYMVMGLTACYLLASDPRSPLKLAWFGVALCSLLVFLSTSKTAMVGMVLSLGVVNITQRFRWRGRLAVIVLDAAFVIGTSISLFIINNWIRLLAGLGKDPTLTGRIPMWEAMIHFIQERPLLGYGRSAFFGPGSPYPMVVGRTISKAFVPPHAHNGFIELALDIGLIGLGLFLISFGLAYLRAISQAFVNRNSGDLWPIAFLTFMLFNNTTETFLLRMTSIFWVLFMSMSLTLAKPERTGIPESRRGHAEILETQNPRLSSP